MRRAKPSSGLAALALALAACSANPGPATPAPQPAPAAAPATAPTAAPVAAPATPAVTPTPAAAPATPAVAPAPAAARRFTIVGNWEWTSSFQGQPYGGTMTVEVQGSGYNALLRVSGMFDATARTVELSGDQVRMVFDSPQGELILEAQFTDPDTLTGRVDVVAAGESATISAVRR